MLACTSIEAYKTFVQSCKKAQSDRFAFLLFLEGGVDEGGEGELAFIEFMRLYGVLYTAACYSRDLTVIHC